MRIAVVCLGAAVALMPLPFVALSHKATGLAIGVTTGLVLVYVVCEAVVLFRGNSPTPAPR